MASNKRYSATITIGGAIASSLRSTFGDTQKNLRAIGDSIRRLEREQRLMGQGIQTFGRMGKNVDGLRDKYSHLTEQVERTRRAQERLQNAAKFHDRAGEIGGKLRGVAASSAGVGLAIGGVLATGVKAAIHRENEINIIKNSGLPAADQKALIAAASGAHQFGVSVTEAFKTVRELQASLGHASLAIEALPTALKAKSGLQLYNRQHAGHEIGEDAMYSLAKIADERGGAASAEEMKRQMNIAFKGITASQGKVSAEDWLTAQRGAKASGIGTNAEAFFGDSFMVQALGAPQYGKALSTLNNAWIGGHQDAHKFTNMLADGLLDRSKVKLKNGLVTNYHSDALIGNKLLIKDQQAWVEKYLIPLAKRKGVNIADSAAVQKFISDYTSNTNAGNVLFQRIYNRAAIDRDRANYLTANGIDESDKINQNSTAGKMDNARARLNDAETRVGTILIPAVATGMERIATALESVNKFADENPRLMKAVVIGLGSLAGGLIIAAPVLLTASGILQTIALVRLVRAAEEVRGTVTALNSVPGAAAKASGGILGFLGKLAAVGLLSGVALEAAKALGLPDTDKKLGEDDVKNGRWLDASAHLPALDFGKAVIHHLSGWKPNLSRTDAAPAAGGLPSLTDNNSAPPPPLPPLNSRGTGNTVNVTNHNTFHITPPNGTSSKQITNDVMTAMDARQRQDMNSTIYDLVK